MQFSICIIYRIRCIRIRTKKGHVPFRRRLRRSTSTFPHQVRYTAFATKPNHFVMNIFLRCYDDNASGGLRCDCDTRTNTRIDLIKVKAQCVCVCVCVYILCPLNTFNHQWMRTLYGDLCAHHPRLPKNRRAQTRSYLSVIFARMCAGRFAAAVLLWVLWACIYVT